MAFTSTILERTIMGNRRCNYGSWDADGDDGGNIDTGLEICETIMLQPKGSAGLPDAPVVNETLPVDGAAVTIANGTSTDVDGYWIAWGY